MILGTDKTATNYSNLKELSSTATAEPEPLEASTLQELEKGKLKRQKNRKAAKLSRLRRKLYERLLEEKYQAKQKIFSDEIKQLKDNKLLSVKMKKYLSLIREKKMLEGRVKAFMTKNPPKDKMIAKTLMEGLMYNVGPCGTIRNKLKNLLVEMIGEEVFAEPFYMVFLLDRGEQILNSFQAGIVNFLESMVGKNFIPEIRKVYQEKVSNIKRRFMKNFSRLKKLKGQVNQEMETAESMVTETSNSLFGNNPAKQTAFLEFASLGTEKLTKFLRKLEFKSQNASESYKKKGDQDQEETIIDSHGSTYSMLDHGVDSESKGSFENKSTEPYLGKRGFPTSYSPQKSNLNLLPTSTQNPSSLELNFPSFQFENSALTNTLNLMEEKVPTNIFQSVKDISEDENQTENSSIGCFPDNLFSSVFGENDEGTAPSFCFDETIL